MIRPSSEPVARSVRTGDRVAPFPTMESMRATRTQRVERPAPLVEASDVDRARGRTRRRVGRLATTSLAVAAGLAAAACGGGSDVDEPAAYAQPDPEYAVSGDRGERLPDLTLENVADEARLDFTHVTGAFGEKWMPETMGSGGAFFDYDGDGLPDVLLVNSRSWPGHELEDPPATPRLFRNQGDGTFRDVTGAAGLDVRVYGMGATAADFDADGDQDLYITAVGDNLLLRNDGETFTDVTDRLGATGSAPDPDVPEAWSTAAAWVDTDRDGWLDLFVCNYVEWTPETDLYTTMDGETKSYATPEQYDGETCRLYRNQEGEGFEDVTEEAGVLNPDGKSLGVVVDDLNGDGWPDLMVANDTYRNFLYLNDGDGTFTDAGVRAGVAYDEFGRARAGMGVDVARLGDDAGLSVAIGNFSHEAVALFTQTDPELFQDRAGPARLNRPSLLPLTFGVDFADMDLDGHVDLLLANGHIEPEINRVQQDVRFEQSPQLFINDGTGQFLEATERAGETFAEPVVGRGLATADYDRDGDPDVLLTVNGGPPRLFRSELAEPDRHWLRLGLEGRAPNLDAVGATVELFAGDATQRRYVRTGASYLSQSEENPILFGLGSASEVDSVRVTWPTSGETVTLRDLEADRHYRLREGRSTARLASESGEGS